MSDKIIIVNQMDKFKLKLSATITFLVIVLFIILMYLSLFSKKSVPVISPLAGKPAPSFTLKSFDDKEINSKTLKGKGLVLNFWSSWCIPCKDEVGVLNRAKFKYADQEIVFIGINIWDERSSSLLFLNKYKTLYLNAYDPDNEIQVNYGIQGVPETYFINKNGIITNRFQGQLTDNILDYFINQMSGQQPK